jgi:hypothetical protein
MRPVERDTKRNYSRLCLRIEHLEEIYRLVVAANHRFDFEYGDDVIEGIEDFDKLREMRKSARYIRVFSEQIRLPIRPASADLEARNLTLAGIGILLLEIDQILRNQQTFWSVAKLVFLGRFFMLLIIFAVGFWLANPQGVHGIPFIVTTLIFLSFATLISFCQFMISRRVKIKWGRQLHFAPILEKVISSVIANIIFSIIAFFVGVYLAPIVKPFLP